MGDTSIVIILYDFVQYRVINAFLSTALNAFLSTAIFGARPFLSRASSGIRTVVFINRNVTLKFNVYLTNKHDAC